MTTRFINRHTGQVEHPHPMFDSMQQQLLAEASRKVPQGAGFVVVDGAGAPVCGRFCGGGSLGLMAVDLLAVSEE